MAINKTEIQAILTTDVSKWTVDDMNKVRMFILENILNTSGKSNIGYETYQKINEAITEAVEGAKTYDDVLKKIDAKLKSGLLNEIRSRSKNTHLSFIGEKSSEDFEQIETPSIENAENPQRPKSRHHKTP